MGGVEYTCFDKDETISLMGDLAACDGVLESFRKCNETVSKLSVPSTPVWSRILWAGSALAVGFAAGVVFIK